MTNILDYVKWRGDLSFAQDAVNAVDALVFSALSYICYGGSVEAEPGVPVSLREAAEAYFAQEDHEARCRVKNDLELLHLAAASARFGNARIAAYRDQFVPEQETQFAAMTFLLDDGSMFLAFRGTDYSLVGWKEDFNMTFQQTIPAQRLAQQYTRDVALEYSCPMYLGGHSKGGNLAVFAAARSSPMIRSRILGVYSNDGPGFTKYLMGDPGYLAMVPKIRTYVPQSSVIGMLLEHEEPYTVIRSKTVGLLQHDPYSWEVLGREFIPVQEITETSQFLDATIKTWFADMTNAERNQLVDVMFALLGSGGVDSVQELIQPKNIRTYIKILSSDAGMRRILSTEFQNLIEAAKKTRQQFEEEKDSVLLLNEGAEG
ncbi:MAG: DUF2974 domain-containing protein [Oscillospiraceae bacterium]|nr:DUF2974 domain-containing protein [Oscillospiraceae bacterium]